MANPVITNTTSAEVAKTWRTGCPVGPSNLSTIRINQQTMVGTVYRGRSSCAGTGPPTSPTRSRRRSRPGSPSTR
ncbi:hypothetical protein G7085_12575 [Tessaracoccus sp. HDW20]|uniref:hypothetical protein n=1 Tax=Tessaracoccus coleopterorum TaxID=2714950 RepID=UPI0018D3E054|nr:hypothetical protein [Tessaracoccus coleopterorum]NHB85175.1 hypothetical protein [Tessaracoccus coleopterorum]